MKRVDKSHWKDISSKDYVGIEVNCLGGVGTTNHLRMTIIQLKPGKFCLHDPYEPIHILEDREKKIYMSIEDLLIKPAEVFGIRVYSFHNAEELNDWLTYKYE